MIVWNRVTWYSKLLAAILFILIIPALAFYIGNQYGKTTEYVRSVEAAQKMTQNQWASRAPKLGIPNFAYRCGDGSEFTVIPSVDREFLHIIPASNIEIIPNVVVKSLPAGSRDRYEGGGVSVFVQGKTLRVTVGERPDVIVCQAIEGKGL